MEDWIEAKYNKGSCELTFHDCLHVVLDDCDVDCLIGLLKGYQFVREYQLV